MDAYAVLWEYWTQQVKELLVISAKSEQVLR
jgi:hypothetical protein